MNTKKFKKLLLLIVIFFLVILCNTNCYADTDVINDYTLKVNPRTDGTLDIYYHIEWKVLDDSEVGPLTDLYIGIPNEHVDSIVGLSKNISNIRYTSNSYGSSGDFVYIKFNESYYTGDTAVIDFSLHQSYMYSLDDSKCTYTFTPGYFNDVKIKNASILWKATDVINSTSRKQDDGYYVWKESLAKGDTITAEVEYYQTAFIGLDANKQMQKQNSYYYDDYYYDDSYDSSSDDAAAVGIIVFFIIFFAIIIAASKSSSGSYYSHRGYGYGTRYGYHHHHHHHHHPPRPRPGPGPRPGPRPAPRPSASRPSSSSSRSSCVSSCACACACAGGGRAGCSRKDLFGIKTKDLKRVLRK